MRKINVWCSALLLAALSHASQAQILIGQTAGFTGAVGAGVKETTDGAKLYIDTVNASGGVNGQKIEVISLDDKFDPKLALENGRQLIEDKNVLAMFLTRGTPHTEALRHDKEMLSPSCCDAIFAAGHAAALEGAETEWGTRGDVSGYVHLCRQREADHSRVVLPWKLVRQ